MRDPKRISIVLKEIEIIWSKNPDLRLCQLLSSVGGFYTEDEDLIVMLKDFFLEDEKAALRVNRATQKNGI